MHMTLYGPAHPTSPPHGNFRLRPDEYPRVVDILLRSLGPEHAQDELEGAGMAPFFYLPHVAFAAE